MRASHHETRADVPCPRNRRKTACRPAPDESFPKAPERVVPHSDSRAGVHLAGEFTSRFPGRNPGRQRPENRSRVERQRNDGFGDFTAGLTMVLRDRHGPGERPPDALQGAGGHGRMATRACSCSTSPGTCREPRCLPTLTSTPSDDQWLYLPALKRVKRISASTRSGSLHGQRVFLRRHESSRSSRNSPVQVPSRRTLRRTRPVP